jgi:hypothetical protein
VLTLRWDFSLDQRIVCGLGRCWDASRIVLCSINSPACWVTSSKINSGKEVASASRYPSMNEGVEVASPGAAWLSRRPSVPSILPITNYEQK